MKQTNTVRIQGQDIPYERRTVPIEAIDLDPKNPRIQFLIGQRGDKVTQDDLNRLIWDKDQVKALAASIFQNGGVYEPLILQKRGNRFIAREGNCRTVAGRHLAEQYPDDPRFATVPAMVFEGELSEEDIAVWLADMHVAGKIRWDAYEQAKHVSELYSTHGKTYDWLSSHLRLSKSKIQELLFGYRATTDFLSAHPAPANIRKFSFFQELAKKKTLREYYEYDPSFRQRFHKWLAEDKLTDAKQVRDLPLMIENVEAGKALEQKGYAAAHRVLVTADPALESTLFSSVKDATERLKEAPVNEINELKLNPQKLILLRNLHRSIEDLATLAGVKL